MLHDICYVKIVIGVKVIALNTFINENEWKLTNSQLKSLGNCLYQKKEKGGNKSTYN